jgi:PST family polysaccharide transporter
MVVGPLMFASYFAGLPWGINGVAAAYAIVMVLLLPPGFAIPFRLVGARFGELATAVWPYLAATLIMAAGTAGVQWATHHAGLARPVCLVASLLTGALIYLGLMWLQRPPAVDDLLGVVRRKRTASGSSK